MTFAVTSLLTTVKINLFLLNDLINKLESIEPSHPSIITYRNIINELENRYQGIFYLVFQRYLVCYRFVRDPIPGTDMYLDPNTGEIYKFL